MYKKENLADLCKQYGKEEGTFLFQSIVAFWAAAEATDPYEYMDNFRLAAEDNRIEVKQYTIR